VKQIPMLTSNHIPNW